jgi:hypothetical protein
VCLFSLASLFCDGRAPSFCTKCPRPTAKALITVTFVSVSDHGVIFHTVLAGKLAAEVVAERALHEHTSGVTTSSADAIGTAITTAEDTPRPTSAAVASSRRPVPSRRPKPIENAVIMRAANAKPRSPVGLQGSVSCFLVYVRCVCAWYCCSCCCKWARCENFESISMNCPGSISFLVIPGSIYCALSADTIVPMSFSSGEGAIVYGGGAVMTPDAAALLAASDPAQLSA